MHDSRDGLGPGEASADGATAAAAAGTGAAADGGAAAAASAVSGGKRLRAAVNKVGAAPPPRGDALRAGQRHSPATATAGYTATSAAVAVAASTLPSVIVRSCFLLSVCSMMSTGCEARNSADASLPAFLRSSAAPPGCSDIKSVKSYATPPITIDARPDADSARTTLKSTSSAGGGAAPEEDMSAAAKKVDGV